MAVSRGEGEGRGPGVGDLPELLKVLSALKNEIRLRVIAMLSEKPLHVYEIAKRLGISYPLAHMHVSALKRVGLVEEAGVVEVDGRRRVLYRAAPFRLVLSPREIRRMVGEE